MTKKYTKFESFWHYTKRFLRTVVPQIPTIMAGLDKVIPKEMFPYMVAFGGLLTLFDKLIRDKGGYKLN